MLNLIKQKITINQKRDQTLFNLIIQLIYKKLNRKVLVQMLNEINMSNNHREQKVLHNLERILSSWISF